MTSGRAKWLSVALMLAFGWQGALAVSLTVRVTGAQGTDGQIIARLFASRQGFPSDAGYAVATASANVPMAANQGLTLNDVPAGTYALIVIHDRNGDGRMAKNFLGLPEEGYGVSNNPRPLLVPRFDEARFSLLDGANQQAISLVYY